MRTSGRNILIGGIILAEEEELPEMPFPQIRFVSLLPFAPPVPVIDFPPPKEVEQVLYQLLNLKGIPEVVELLKGSRG